MKRGRSFQAEGGLCAKALGQNRGIMEPRAGQSTAMMLESGCGWSMVKSLVQFPGHSEFKPQNDLVQT